jgi:hypothetical protein
MRRTDTTTDTAKQGRPSGLPSSMRQENDPGGPPHAFYRKGVGMGYFDAEGHWQAQEKPEGFNWSPAGDGTLVPEDTDATPDEVAETTIEEAPIG